jgi:hypothetical protein
MQYRDATFQTRVELADWPKIAEVFARLDSGERGF